MTAPRPPGLLRQVLLPSEHGSWAFLGEPALLGLLVAPSPPGFLIATAALAGFLARRPLRIALGDLRKRRRYPRTRVAIIALGALTLVGAASAAAALVLARGPAPLALAPVVLLGTIAIAFDLGQRSREMVAELSAGVALGGIAATIALAAGSPARLAFGLWGVLAARTVPTILYVRARVRLDRGVLASPLPAIVACALAIAGVAALARAHAAPWIAVAAMAVLLARALWGLSPRRPHVTTMQLGLIEIGLGIAIVIAVALGSR